MTLQFERKLKLTLWAMTLLFGVAAWLAFQNSRRFVNSSSVGARNDDLHLGIEKLDRHLLEAESAARGWLLTADPALAQRARAAKAAALLDKDALLLLVEKNDAVRTQATAMVSPVLLAMAGIDDLLASVPTQGQAIPKKWDEAVTATAEARKSLLALDGEVRQLAIEREEASRSNNKLSTQLLYGLIGSAFVALCGSLVLIESNLAHWREADAKLKQLNSRLEAANDALLRQTLELKYVNEELEAFSYSVSHDLRAPIRHIGGFLKLLRNSLEPRLPAMAEDFFTTITDATREMGTMVDELLAFSRVGRAELVLVQVSLSEIMEEVRKALTPETVSRNIQWQVGSLPQVEADRSMIRLVFLNLVSNAIKYTRVRETAVIEVGCDSSAPHEHVIYVRDNGVGFDMTYVAKLFGVFQRLHTQEEFEGTGIGLANVRRIIHRHDGRVWAEGQIDRGAVFYFSLPKHVK
jgi:signal transduction histidine kinase